jgi:hypothetical protein
MVGDPPHPKKRQKRRLSIFLMIISISFESHKIINIKRVIMLWSLVKSSFTRYVIHKPLSFLLLFALFLLLPRSRARVFMPGIVKKPPGLGASPGSDANENFMFILVSTGKRRKKTLA